MRLNEKHEVQRNEAFGGLCERECFDLKYYSHFRNVQDETKLSNLEADDAIFQRDFLDECSTDEPTGCWSLQKKADSRRVAMIRHNVWKGYAAYHYLGTRVHGSLYVGDGVKNANFCFTV